MKFACCRKLAADTQVHGVMSSFFFNCLCNDGLTSTPGGAGKPMRLSKFPNKIEQGSQEKTRVAQSKCVCLCVCVRVSLCVHVQIDSRGGWEKGHASPLPSRSLSSPDNLVYQRLAKGLDRKKKKKKGKIKNQNKKKAIIYFSNVEVVD